MIGDELREMAGHSAGEAASLVQGLAEKIGARVGASTIFGEPVESGGVTVIPIAKARWGCAGGAGSGAAGGQKAVGGDGAGGGGGLVGGMLVTPVGFIEIRDGGARYRPIVDPLLIPITVAIGTCIGLAIARGGGRRRRP